MANDFKRSVRRLTFLAVAATDGAVLTAGRSWPGEGGRALLAPHAYVTQAGADRGLLVVTGAALWIVALWLAIGLAAAATSRLPGRLGRCGGRLAEVTLPRALTRLCAGALGASVLLGPVSAAVAAPAATDSSPVRSVTAAAAVRDPGLNAVPTPGWPAGSTAATPTSQPNPLPTPSWPHGSPTSVPGQPSAPGRTPTPPTASTPPPTSTTSSPAAASVRVQPGDSLWLIAARRLGPSATTTDITAAWPRWYAANRGVIGSDPSLIHPGQVLVPPTDQP